MNSWRNFFLTITVFVFCNVALAEEIVTPFLESSRYGCLQDEYGTALVIIRSDGDYGLRRFSAMINRTKTNITNLRLRLRWLKSLGASSTRITRVQAKLDNKRSFLSSIRNCKGGTPPGQTPAQPVNPTPNNPDSDVPCAVVGNLVGATNRIINGATCTVGNSPVVELELLAGGSSEGWCSGTALTKRAVLTAAHCLTDGVTSVKVHAGSTAIQSSSIHYHPGYDSSSDEAYDMVD